LHPLVKKLLELQIVDQEIVSLTKDIDSLPAEEGRRRRRLDELQRAAADAQNRFLKAELESRSLEKAIRGSDDEIKRLDERLGQVRNNAEYQATLFQIEAVRKDRDVMQEECLKLIEQVEGLRPEVTTAQAVVAAEQKVLDAFLAEAETLRSSRAGAIAAVRGRRKGMSEGLPEDLLHDYDGLFKTRDGIGVCAVENGYCQGCYNKITMNDTARLLGKSTVVKCGSCQRILYLGK
jgi:predicted  nucleic acid-binding Zn-ribbon protein